MASGSQEKLKLDDNKFPDEMLINIFLKLGEADILQCRMVCKRWSEVAKDKYLIYYFRHQDIPLVRSIIDSCEKGNILSFNIGVTVYCAYDVRSVIRDSSDIEGGAHDLWAKCMIAAAKGGTLPILRKILNYGPTYGFDEAINMCVIHNHPECAKIIERERIIY